MNLYLVTFKSGFGAKKYIIAASLAAVEQHCKKESRKESRGNNIQITELIEEYVTIISN